jgi:hypothetical protein
MVGGAISVAGQKGKEMKTTAFHLFSLPFNRYRTVMAHKWVNLEAY